MARPFTLVLIFFLALTACEKENVDPDDGPITNILLSSNTYNFETLAKDVDKSTLSFIDADVPNAPLVSYVILGEMFDSRDNRGWYIFSNVVEYLREMPLEN